MQTSEPMPSPPIVAPAPARPIVAKDGSVAALLEVLPGLFFQTFGIGHIYAGNVVTGLVLMFGYWCVQAINVLLMFVLVGFVTAPLCWIAAMIISPIIASRSCRPT